MKEPGQIAHHAFYTALHITDVQIKNNWRRSETREGWAAVEAACRAEGMREAARIAAKFANGSAEWARHSTAIEAAILSAIGGQK